MVDAAHFVLMADTVAAVRDCDEFLTEGADNELGRIVFVVRLALNDTGNSSTVGRVERLIELIEQVERSGIATCQENKTT